jgi:hypothetical protein
VSRSIRSQSSAEKCKKAIPIGLVIPNGFPVPAGFESLDKCLIPGHLVFGDKSISPTYHCGRRCIYLFHCITFWTGPVLTLIADVYDFSIVVNMMAQNAVARD